MRRGAAWAAQPGQISLDVERIAELRRAVLRSCEPRRARRCVGTGGEDDEQAAAHRDSVSGLLFLLEVTEELAALDATVVEENRLVLAPALRTGERLHLDGLGADAAAVHLEVRLENEARRPAGAALALTLALALLRLRHRPIAVPAVARHGPILSPDQRTGSARQRGDDPVIERDVSSGGRLRTEALEAEGREARVARAPAGFAQQERRHLSIVRENGAIGPDQTGGRVSAQRRAAHEEQRKDPE